MTHRNKLARQIGFAAMVGLASCAITSSLCSARIGETNDAPTLQEIELLVDQLGHEHYIRREQARVKLAELGEQLDLL